MFKIRILLLVLSLSSLCLGENNDKNIADNVYHNLLGFLQMGKFAEFKRLYTESTISDSQKAGHIKIATDIIELEKKNWSKHTISYMPGFLGDIATVKGREIKRRIKILAGIAVAGLSIASIALGWFGMGMIIKLETYSKVFTQLGNGNIAIPTGNTAAQMGVALQLVRKDSILSKVAKGLLLIVPSYVVGVIAFVVLAKLSLIRFSYKRFKGATKIKQLLEAV